MIVLSFTIQDQFVTREVAMFYTLSRWCSTNRATLGSPQFGVIWAALIAILALLIALSLFYIAVGPVLVTELTCLSSRQSC
jgi:hypothetical protein